MLRRGRSPSPPPSQPTESPHQAELERLWKERLTLEAAFRELSWPDSEHSEERILKLFRQLIACRTAAFFEWTDGSMVPMVYEGGARERLGSWRLLGLTEPALEEAHRSRAEIAVKGSAICPEEEGLLLPLGDFAVVYLGKTTAFTPDEATLARLIAAQAGLSGQGMRRMRSEKRALEERAEMARELQAQLTRLALLQTSLQEVTQTLNPEEIIESVSRFVERLNPEGWALWLSHKEGMDFERGDLQDDRIPQLAEGALSSRAPILVLSDLTLLIVPLVAESTPYGALVLAAPTTDAFPREVQDLLSAFCLGAAGALANARLYRELEESQMQLIHTSKMAAIGQLAAGVAHELNTPIGAACLGIQAARHNLLPSQEESAKKLERAHQALKKAGDIIDKLLSYSRLPVAAKVKLSLCEIGREALALLQPVLERENIKVQSEWGEAGTAVGNPLELQQVVTNLLMNSLDALRGRPERLIQVVTGLEAGRCWLRVTDSGPGISPEVAVRMFDPFFTTKAVGKGTGLGLSLSRQLARQHGGDVEALGGQPGASFRLWIPVDETFKSS